MCLFRIERTYFDREELVLFNCSSTKGCLQGFVFALRIILDPTPCTMPHKTVMKLQHNYFLSATLAQTFNNRCSALTGAAITDPAFAEPFIAAGAAVGLFAVFFIVF